MLKAAFRNDRINFGAFLFGVAGLRGIALAVQEIA